MVSRYGYHNIQRYNHMLPQIELVLLTCAMGEFHRPTLDQFVTQQTVFSLDIPIQVWDISPDGTPLTKVFYLLPIDKTRAGLEDDEGAMPFAIKLNEHLKTLMKEALHGA
jgi:hypothetical protein